MPRQSHTLRYASGFHTPAALNSSLEEAKTEAFGLYLVNCSSMAARAWLFWDVLITLDDEIEILWRMRWTFTKFLYYFIRYGGVFLQVVDLGNGIDGNDCSVWTMVFRTMVAYFFTVSLEYILLLRVYALYYRDRVKRRLIRGFFYVVAGVMLAAAALFISSIRRDRPCSFVASYPAVYAHVVASHAFQFILLILTLAPIVQMGRSGWKKTRIMPLLARDGTWSFLTVNLISIFYALMLRFAHPSVHHLLFNWIISTYSFIGYRNLLNIFSLSSQPQTYTQPAALFSTNLPETLTLEEYEMQIGLTTRDD